MASVKVRNLEIGTGTPKVCVPIVGKTVEEICQDAKRIAESSADLAEWRVDWFDEVADFDKVKEALGMLREILGEKPLLFTCRTAGEGGEISLTTQQYAMLCEAAIESRLVDLIDVEMIGFEAVVEELVNLAHEKGVKVVGSNHDFVKTPAKDEIIRRLCKMQNMGADVTKMAVMPQNAKDVLELLSATEEMTRLYPVTPIVTMSMGAMGVISRISGEVFGSAITFATVGKASAPGQLEIEELKKAMNWQK